MIERLPSIIPLLPLKEPPLLGDVLRVDLTLAAILKLTLPANLSLAHNPILDQGIQKFNGWASCSMLSPSDSAKRIPLLPMNLQLSIPSPTGFMDPVEPKSSMAKHYLACDLGAESGRLVHGVLEENQLSLEEIHRFPNTPIRNQGSIHWNIDQLFHELQKGLEIAARLKQPFQSISCDSWGVDYILFDADNAPIPPTFHYRDPRTAIGTQRTFRRVDWPTIFAETGVQMMQLNALYQLAAEEKERLQNAQTLLGVGDGFNCLLGGKAVIEISMASTFQLFNPKAGAWSTRLLDLMDFPRELFPSVVPSGSRIGALSPELQRATGLPELEIVATCSHDTGAAVAAVPAKGPQWAYLSSGTWSLMGVERAEPILTDACRDLNFTNEIGYGNSIRLLKNISGLWLLQESRRVWEDEGSPYDYAKLTELARNAQPFASLVNPTEARFVAPENMPAAIAAFCQESEQPKPQGAGAVTRCILESLALLYRKTLEELEALTGESIEVLHIVGGGSKNDLLNQFTANAIQRPVITGPVEATAAGNILIQALALGHLQDLGEAREIVRGSSHLKTYSPMDREAWEAARRRFAKLLPTQS